MLGKLVMFLLFLLTILVGVYFIYENIPGEPIKLEKVFIEEKNFKPIYIEDGAPVFMENLRFTEEKISYYIEPTCPEKRKQRMIYAFNIVENYTEMIEFYSFDSHDADILVGCSKDYREVGDKMFIAGEGGPSEIINTSLFKVITEGKIMLYRESNCDYPVVEIHELMHVLGFDHVDDEMSVMYNVSDCDQRITSQMIDRLNALYAIKALPDLYFEDVWAIKKGRYLDFNVSVRNQGLENAENVNLSIYSEGDLIESFELNDIPIGTGRILYIQNLRLDSRSSEKIGFIIDSENKIDEITKKNNFVELST